MPANVRRHAVYWSDREIMLVELALRAYAQIMQIQAGQPPRYDADDTARVTAVVQFHKHCKCSHPEGVIDP